MRTPLVNELLDTLASANTPRARALAQKIKKRFPNGPSMLTQAVTLRDTDYHNLVRLGTLLEDISAVGVKHNKRAGTVTVSFSYVPPAQRDALLPILAETIPFIESFITATSSALNDDLAWENARARALHARLTAVCSLSNVSAKA